MKKITLSLPAFFWKKGIRLFTHSFIICCLVLFSINAVAQSGDLSQIRNGNGKVQNSTLDTCGSCWVNGNAGSSNAHYVEGMSIAYRSLLTGLTPGVCYEYEIGYDTYHGAMAIDYLTHFQRLQPHSPFGHIAEVINPLAMVSGSTNYNMTVITNGTKTFDIPVPNASNIPNGSTFDKSGNPKSILNQPVTSFNALPVAQRKMTIYNGEIEAMTYSQQAAIVLGGADAETKIKIRFRADDDSVLLAWGGHIGSRLDWGYTKDNKGKLVPLSAGGISGSPYHMRQKAMKQVDCGTGANGIVLSGFGNQDRSLSAAAVVAPPECPTVANQTICSGGSFAAFTIGSPQDGTTYTWSFATNGANAAFSGGGSTATGNSVTVVAGSGGFTAGSFTFNITASLNSIDLVCASATGTVVGAPSVVTKYNPPSCSSKVFSVDVINPTAGYTYTIDQPDNTLTFTPVTPSNTTTFSFTGLTNGDGFVVTVTTDVGGCTATSSCTNPSTGSSRLATNTETADANRKGSVTYDIKLESLTKANGVPNPYTDKIRFNMVSAVSGMGSLELYNIQGQKVGVVFQGYVQAGQELTKEYVVTRAKGGTLIYVFKVGDQRVTGKMIGIK